jgi:hypothetical protein
LVVPKRFGPFDAEQEDIDIGQDVVLPPLPLP